MLNNGRHPRMGTEPLRDSKMDTVDTFVKNMEEARKEAESALKKAADDMANFHDHNRGTPVKYKVGDMAWLDGKDLKTDRPTNKLDDKRYGPYKFPPVISHIRHE